MEVRVAGNGTLDYLCHLRAGDDTAPDPTGGAAPPPLTAPPWPDLPPHLEADWEYYAAREGV
ncbi:MAG TPA: hypothetical protein VFY17_11350 [Pilimelia sp.]|nr:hypothetical protein [Pilimelia sp.]